MTPDDIHLVQMSFKQLQPKAAEVGLIVYERLFETHPDLRPMFGSNIWHQSRKLMQVLAVVVTSLDRLTTILPTVEDLARRHETYGVRHEHYSIVGETLRWTLAQGLGWDFMPQVETAWLTAYATICGEVFARLRMGLCLRDAIAPSVPRPISRGAGFSREVQLPAPLTASSRIAA
ncbi:globin domain-containing protein [Stappia sp. P2PMeth1]|uniref:globin domain-containing protein n=1 Tax=Stappia sp. P2PMeth1 TaxID=2003586 RepID=UPI001644A06F|nr:globin domain-containing protein [Stappia sp. P2PMeth1]